VTELAAINPEDAKLVRLARAARARNRAAEGAAVRDRTGRTYAATTVNLYSLSLTAMQAAVAMAVASGTVGLEAAAVVTEAAKAGDADVSVARELGGPGMLVMVAGPDGTLRDRFEVS
jgi:hypothetical protein